MKRLCLFKLSILLISIFSLCILTYTMEERENGEKNIKTTNQQMSDNAGLTRLDSTDSESESAEEEFFDATDIFDDVVGDPQGLADLAHYIETKNKRSDGAKQQIQEERKTQSASQKEAEIRESKNAQLILKQSENNSIKAEDNSQVSNQSDNSEKSEKEKADQEKKKTKMSSSKKIAKAGVIGIAACGVIAIIEGILLKYAPQYSGSKWLKEKWSKKIIKKSEEAIKRGNADQIPAILCAELEPKVKVSEDSSELRSQAIDSQNTASREKTSGQKTRSENKLIENFENNKYLDAKWQTHYQSFINSFVTEQISKLKRENKASFFELLQNGKKNPEIFLNRENLQIKKFWDLLNETQKEVLDFIIDKYRKEVSEDPKEENKNEQDTRNVVTVVQTPIIAPTPNVIVVQNSNSPAAGHAPVSQGARTDVVQDQGSSKPSPRVDIMPTSACPSVMPLVVPQQQIAVQTLPEPGALIDQRRNRRGNLPSANVTTPAVQLSTGCYSNEQDLRKNFEAFKNRESWRYLYTNLFFLSVSNEQLNLLEVSDRDFIKILLSEAEDNPTILRIVSDDQDVLVKFLSILNGTQQEVLNFIIDKYLAVNGQLAQNNSQNNRQTSTTTAVAQNNDSEKIEEEALAVALIGYKNSDWKDIYDLFVSSLTKKQQEIGAEFLTEAANDPSVFEITNYSKVSLIEFVATLSNSQWKCIELAIKNYRDQLKRQYS